MPRWSELAPVWGAGAFDEVEPFPDVKPGFAALREAGVQARTWQRTAWVQLQTASGARVSI